VSRIRPSHPYLDVLEPYEPPDLAAAAERAGVSEDELIRMVANENPFGPSPRVAEALRQFGAYHFHPDYGKLKTAVARYAGASPEQVVLGNGADELIDLLVRLFVEPGDVVVTCPPTFSQYRFAARVNRCGLLSVPRRADLSLNLEALEQAVREGGAGSVGVSGGGTPRILFVASPANPSGQALGRDVIDRLLDLPLVVALDEAYIEFGGASAVPLLSDHPNLVVLRTFSKWAGMAGLRLGYALVTPALAEDLNRIRLPYNVNAAAMVAALATFEDLETVQANLREDLRALPFLEPLPSQANFILCRVLGREAKDVAEKLVDHGILVLSFPDPVLEHYVRISIGRPEQNRALVHALRTI